MCLGISAPTGGQIELAFALERLRLRRNGAKQIAIDVLIKNVGETPIRRFRFEFPCRFWGESELDREENETWEMAFSRLCRQQCSRVRITTAGLTQPHDLDNWIYRVLPHLSLGEWDPRTGLVPIRRGDLTTLTGLIKQDWKFEISEELGDDPHRWYSCFSNGITVLDLVAPDERSKEHLQQGECMWVSVQFTVPPGGSQYFRWPSRWRSLLARDKRSRLVLMSPRAFSDWRTCQLSVFERQAHPGEAQIHVAARKVRELLGAVSQPQVKDWRLFMHWSNRISIQRIQVPQSIVESPSDDSLHIPDRNLDASNHAEFWFGEDHGKPEPTDGLRLQFEAVVENWLYKYVLPWIGFVAFVLALWQWIRHW